MKNVSILIPNWNGRELLAAYLGSVVTAAEYYQKSFDVEVEILLIDDASTDQSLDWLQSEYGENPLVQVIELEKNHGFLLAVNKGFSLARHPIVFLLNSDVSVEPDCIRPLAKHFLTGDVFAVCCHANRMKSDRLDGGGKLGIFERGFWRVFRNYDVYPRERAELISFYGSGGYTAYDREKWRELGGFQACLSPNYWEDVEIGYRAWKRGWRVLYEPASIVHHLGSASMKKSKSRDDLDVVQERNRLLMTWINLHDGRMFASHTFWVLLKLIGSALSLKWNFLYSFIQAIKLLGSVGSGRNIERNAAVVSDRELRGFFQQLVKRNDIHILDSYEAEIAFADRKQDIAEPERFIG